MKKYLIPFVVLAVSTNVIFAKGTKDENVYLISDEVNTTERSVSTSSTQEQPKADRGVFIGGTAAFGFNEALTFAFEPIIGYEFSHRWAAGLGFGTVLNTDFTDLDVKGIVEPFVRFCAWHNNIVYIDVKARAGLGFDRELQLFQLGACPSLRFRINRNFDVAADFGFLGVQFTQIYGWQATAAIDATSAALWLAYRF